MENFTLRKADSHMIACVREVPEKPEGVVIAIHGFTSSKESSTVSLLLRRLPAAGFCVIGIDLPGHGTEESAQEILRTKGALDSIEAAEEYAVSCFPDLPICYFASSFGAYLTGLYISLREHKGRKAFFRSAAVNMPSLFIKDDLSEKEKRQMEELKEKGYFDSDMDLHKAVRITQGLMDDFAETDLFAVFDPDRFGEHQIRMAHGTKDDVIAPEAAKRFADQFHIPITFFEGEGHSLSDLPGTAEKVADLAIRLFSKEM